MDTDFFWSDRNIIYDYVRYRDNRNYETTNHIFKNEYSLTYKNLNQLGKDFMKIDNMLKP